MTPALYYTSATVSTLGVLAAIALGDQLAEVTEHGTPRYSLAYGSAALLVVALIWWSRGKAGGEEGRLWRSLAAAVAVVSACPALEVISAALPFGLIWLQWAVVVAVLPFATSRLAWRFCQFSRCHRARAARLAARSCVAAIVAASLVVLAWWSPARPELVTNAVYSALALTFFAYSIATRPRRPA